MKYINKFKRFIVLESSNSYKEYYRGVGVDEAIESLRLGHLIYYSNDPITNDWEVIEYSIGDSASEMPEDEITEYLNELIPWIDIDRGVNLTTDIDNAFGYSDIVFGIQVFGNYAEFGKSYIFAEHPKECFIRKCYYRGREIDSGELLKLLLSNKKTEF